MSSKVSEQEEIESEKRRIRSGAPSSSVAGHYEEIDTSEELPEQLRPGYIRNRMPFDDGKLKNP